MILSDVNVLVHAHNSDSPVHERARHWWDGCLAGTEGVAHILDGLDHAAVQAAARGAPMAGVTAFRFTLVLL